MRVGFPTASLALLVMIACIALAIGAEAPEFVIPGRRDVPVIVNPLGFDASYTVVEGDFGLDRPGQVNPVIVGGPRVRPMPYYHGSYFPSSGHQPGYGRLEIEQRNRTPPKPAEPYYRGWGAASDPIPATLDPPTAFPIEGVAVDGRRWWDGDRWRDRDDRKLRRQDRPRPPRPGHR
jgi:hypothetical protein